VYKVFLEVEGSSLCTILNWSDCGKIKRNRSDGTGGNSAHSGHGFVVVMVVVAVVIVEVVVVSVLLIKLADGSFLAKLHLW